MDKLNIIMIICNIISIAFLSVGLYEYVTYLLKCPSAKATKAYGKTASRQKQKPDSFNIVLESFSKKLAKFIPMDEFKRAEMEADLTTAGFVITPEEFQAYGYLKMGLLFLVAIVFLFILPIGSAFFALLAILVYMLHKNSLKKRIQNKRDNIEYELSRFVFVIKEGLKNNRDVLTLLETYAKGAEKEFANELRITIADMKATNYEDALNRFDKRIGLNSLSDITRGLIGVIRGNVSDSYWENLAETLTDAQKQRLVRQANKVPGKVNKLSLMLTFLFTFIFLATIFISIIPQFAEIFG